MICNLRRQNVTHKHTLKLVERKKKYKKTSKKQKKNIRKCSVWHNSWKPVWDVYANLNYSRRHLSQGHGKQHTVASIIRKPERNRPKKCNKIIGVGGKLYRDIIYQRYSFFAFYVSQIGWHKRKSIVFPGMIKCSLR